MATTTQTNVVDYYGNYTQSLGSEIYRQGDRGEEFDDEVEWLKSVWDTDNGQIVCEYVEAEMANLHQYMNDMESAVNRIHSSKISYRFEDVEISREKISV